MSKNNCKSSTGPKAIRIGLQISKKSPMGKILGGMKMLFTTHSIFIKKISQ